MSKSNQRGESTKGGTKRYYPMVSVCTPTFNRRPFMETLFQCFRNQDYPKSKMEWIIVDDGTDCIADLVIAANIPQIKYFREEKKMTLGHKRNFMHTKAKGSILVYMDDDDYYPPCRVSHAVERLTETKGMLAGTEQVHVYFPDMDVTQGPESETAATRTGHIVAFGPYPSTPNHSTAASFAFRRELLDMCAYNNTEALAEERAFLNGFSVPRVTLDPLKTILVFSHDHNTFDKRGLLRHPWSPEMQKTDLSVADFIRGYQGTEGSVARFFLEDMKTAVDKYAAGAVSNKPDVVVGLARLEGERAAQAQAQAQAQVQVVHTNQDGTQTILGAADMLALVQGLDANITELTRMNVELVAKIESLTKDLDAERVKLTEAENKLMEAENKLTEAENKLTEAEKKVVEAEDKVSKNMTVIYRVEDRISAVRNVFTECIMDLHANT